MVNELSELFKISDVTILMDSADLEIKGLFSRIHGGAVNSYKNMMSFAGISPISAVDYNVTNENALKNEIAFLKEYQYFRRQSQRINKLILGVSI